ncbi:MAG: cob(I)yrinic acid a,c-diamide adenosyltransferase [Endomicrobium sp.]|jgi:cob(I)alamin adenosyltransferase|nr:cob(I)yrinic acid a,c-diamide adenosyltransferase [Endomicrobium sp.]
MIIINTGNGKGKTTAAVGQIIRFLSHGFKVCMIQLFKNEKYYGEQKILVDLKNFYFFPFAKNFSPYDNLKNTEIETIKDQCALALNKAKEILNNSVIYDVLVLEEFNIALRNKYIDKHNFIKLIKLLSQKLNLIITGRYASKDLINMADIVTEMKEIKHHYNSGVKFNKGIEF